MGRPLWTTASFMTVNAMVTKNSARVLILSRDGCSIRKAITQATSTSISHPCFRKYKILQADVEEDARLLSRDMVNCGRSY